MTFPNKNETFFTGRQDGLSRSGGYDVKLHIPSRHPVPEVCSLSYRLGCPPDLRGPLGEWA
jgi:hypothetical protein